MRITMDDGVELAVDVAGDGPGLVLVHGFGGAKEDFADHVDALAATHTVVTFDHRGHGASDKPEEVEGYSFERLRADTLGVVDALGFERVRMLGHSMGGMVVRRIAIDHPDRIEALIMMDTSAGPIPGFDPALMDVAAQHALDNGKDALRELLDMAAPLETAPHQRLVAERPGYKEFGERKWADLSHVMWAALAREIAHQSDDLDAMRALDMPVLAIVGALDKPFVPAAQALADAISGARLVIVDDAGHSPQFENPTAWRDAIVEFLAGLPAAV